MSMSHQITIFEYMNDLPARPVKIMGLCDDAYCPNCGYGFFCTSRDIDCEICPECKIRVDWTPWHRVNDEEDEVNE